MYKAILLLLLAAGCPGETPVETDTDPIDPIPDPVVHYTFDSDDAVEAMGTGLDAILHDDATTTADGAFDTRSLLLDGEGDYAEVVNDPRLMPDEFTLAAWVWMASDLDDTPCWGQSCSVISMGNTDDDTTGYWLSVDENALLRLNIHNGRDETSIFGTNAVTTDEWHLLVGSFDGENVRLYVDGELDGRGEIAHGIKYGDEPFLIGAMTDRIGQYEFPGMIDDVMLWDEVLDEEDVARLYEP